MRIYDRLYGELKFPPIVRSLLSCPGLLRLRDVRMANNQFAAFPSFASASRYEHSLGVCHLAELCADELGLSEKDKMELMIACLYHDVGTPPFAHAMEEVLHCWFGFDHEHNLRSLLTGDTDEFDGEDARVFMGEGLKLRSVCQSKAGRLLGLDIYRIAGIVAGDQADPLAALLNSPGMDLDNIDNVLRASTAMGIADSSLMGLPERLAKSFAVEAGRICYKFEAARDIELWQDARWRQYDAIYRSVEDFAYQTMIKKAVSLAVADESLSLISSLLWRKTDSEMVTDVLMASEASRPIYRRVLLCRPFECLSIYYVSGDGVVGFLNSHLDDIEEVASDRFLGDLGAPRNDLASYGLSAVVANYYPDKRRRPITDKPISGKPKGYVNELAKEGRAEGAYLGLFTPLGSSSSRYVVNENGSRSRVRITFSDESAARLAADLSNGVLSGFEVTICGRGRFG